MTLTSSIRLVLGLAACGVVLILAALWGEVPARYGPCPEDPAEPYSIAHCVLGPSRLVAVLKLAISLLAIAGSAVLAAMTVQKSRVIIGAAAASLCSLVGLSARHVVFAQTFDVGFAPSLSAVAIVACVFFLFGALVVWGMARWWPNKSLERTREG
jgi:hypothetical protein